MNGLIKGQWFRFEDDDEPYEFVGEKDGKVHYLCKAHEYDCKSYDITESSNQFHAKKIAATGWAASDCV